ncbi:mu-type opioid receptor-like [Bolinopsis microptera]|uniref:mu-type opioid receptor-like n=1 Tax=Bolinopsis microptera TaxID=2820187 RepID=UPI00307AE5F6
MNELVRIENTKQSFSEDWSPATRPLLIVLTAVICLVGFLGNCLVLHGSLHYNALRLEKISRSLVQSIALCDALASLLLYFPVVVTLISDRWVLGQAVCFVVAHSNYLLVLNEIWLVLFMSGYRIWVLKKPKGHRLSKRSVWIVAGIQLGLSIVLLVYSLCMKITAEYRSISCDTNLYYDKEAYGGYLTIAILIIPLVCILILNTFLLFSVCLTNKASHRSLSSVRKPTIMLSLVTLIELVSLVPVVYMIMLSHTDPRNTWLRSNLAWFRILAVYMVSLNVCSNPVIYLATNRSFRGYVRGILQCKRAVKNNSVVSREFKSTTVVQNRLST